MATANKSPEGLRWRDDEAGGHGPEVQDPGSEKTAATARYLPRTDLGLSHPIRSVIRQCVVEIVIPKGPYPSRRIGKPYPHSQDAKPDETSFVSPVRGETRRFEKGKLRFAQGVPPLRRSLVHRLRGGGFTLRQMFHGNTFASSRSRARSESRPHPRTRSRKHSTGMRSPYSSSQLAFVSISTLRRHKPWCAARRCAAGKPWSHSGQSRFEKKISSSTIVSLGSGSLPSIGSSSRVSPGSDQ